MLSVLRIVSGVVFITVGTMKMFGFPPLPPGMPPIALVSELGLASILETVGGTAFVIGLLTRPVAFVLSGAVAGLGCQRRYVRLLPGV